MRKLRLTMAGLLCGGLLLMGIGAGVMFLEFSVLSYGGEKLPEQAEQKSQSFTVEMQETGIYELDLVNYYSASGADVTLRSDSTVPKGSIEVRVDYGSISLEPHLWVESNEIGKYHVGMNWNGWSDDMAFFMACKDEILAELKEGKISSYQGLLVDKVSVSVHPDEESRVRLMSRTGGVDYYNA